MLVGLKYSEFSIHHRDPLSSLIYIIIYILLGTIFYCTPYPNWLLFFRGFTHQPVDPSGELWREAFARSGSPKITRWLLPERAIKPRLMCLGLEGAFLFWHFVVQSNCYLSLPSAAKRAAPEAAPVAVAGSHVCQGSHTCVLVATPQNLGRVGSAGSDERCSNMTNKNAADIIPSLPSSLNLFMIFLWCFL